jgi:2,3-bisphosphoglycerate-dependent phosphoglycerate mutase
VTRIVYVRHGESNSTVNRTIGGHRTCTGLSELGHRQAAALRDRWLAAPDITPDLIVSSHFTRAQQTAEYIAAAFGKQPVVVDDGFGEHDPGEDCDGMAMEEFIEKHGTSAWSEDPFGITFPGGETLAEFHFRIGRAVRRLVDGHPDRTIVVACHGGVVDTVVRQALKTSMTGGFQFQTQNTSITELQLVRPNHWVLHRYGDAAHLAPLTAATPATGTGHP